MYLEFTTPPGRAKDSVTSPGRLPIVAMTVDADQTVPSFEVWTRSCIPVPDQWVSTVHSMVVQSAVAKASMAREVWVWAPRE
jgi:hypothetical protein